MTTAARPLLVGLAALASALVAAAFTASPSSAGLLPRCDSQTLQQPFLRWLDPMNYVLAPNGGFEDGSAGWALTGGAKVVSGNESFYVRGGADSKSLSLPTGASATTGEMCIGLLHPTVRLFVSNTGSMLSTLKVEALVTDASGKSHTSPVGLVLGTRAWQPTLPLLILQNLRSLPLVTDGTTSVAFRFTAQGLLGSWKIDDLYVDPFKGV
jgi:hypothetical protein